MLFLKLLGESFRFAFSALRENKLRTFLSLVGITIGILVIIGVFSGVDTLRNNLQSSVEKLGNNTVYIQKWPWTFDSNMPWWKMMNRPSPQPRDYNRLIGRVEGAEGVALEVYMGNRTIKYKSTNISGVQIGAATFDFKKIRSFDFDDGRYFTEAESNAGSAVAIIGKDIADGLFPNSSPLGKRIKVIGRNVTVVGVFAKEGEDMLGISNDKTVQLPLNFVRGIVDIRSDRYDPTITVKGKEGVSVTELESELRGVMRSIRRLGPKEDDDFALNKTTMLSAQLDVMFGVVNTAGGFIGFLSALVGGFGIANIMFVSVKERTNLIGIQKSLGAKNYFIMLQFLFEAIAMCLMGGFIGLALVYVVAFGFKWAWDMTIVVGIGKVIATIVISTILGLISGIIPAFLASRLNPVEAIRSK